MKITFRVWDNKLKCYGHGCRNQLTDRSDHELCISDTAIGFKKNDGHRGDTALNFYKCSYREIVNNPERFQIELGAEIAENKYVYDNDIVKVHKFCEVLGENLGVSEGEQEFIAKAVLYSASGMWLEANGNESGCLHHYEDNGFHEESFEVIGNVNENPELL